jgi:hypothetical protein
MAALSAAFLCASASADTVIDADCFKFHTTVPDIESPANDFHLTITGQFVGDPSSDAMPNRTTTNDTVAGTGTSDFSGGTVLDGNKLCVKFKSAGGTAPSPTGYFTKDHKPVGDSSVQSKALDNSVVSYMPASDGFYANLTLRNGFGVPLWGSVQVVVNSGFHTNYNLEEYDMLRNPRVVLPPQNFALAPGEGFTNLNAFLTSSDDYLLIQGMADAGDGAGPSPFAIAISPVDEAHLCTLPAGYSTIANNFNIGANSLEEVWPNPADGTMLFKFDSLASNYLTFYYSSDFGWEPAGGTLAPGEGAFVSNPAGIQSVLFTGEIPPPAPRPRLPAGRYLVSCPMPQPCSFEQLMGFPPAIGDRVDMFTGTLTNLTDPASKVCSFTTSGWDRVPVLLPGTAAFVTLANPQQVILPLASNGSLGPLNPFQDVLFDTVAGTFQVGGSIMGHARTALVYTARSPAPLRVFDFTDINIPQSVTVRATGELPLVLLAQGQAVIDGTIDVSGLPGGNAGRWGGGGGGGGGGALALFANNLLVVTPNGRILAQGGPGGMSLPDGDCFAAGPGGIAGPGGGRGSAGGASVAGGAGGNGGAAALGFWGAIFLGEGGGGGGGGAYAGPGGIGGPGLAVGNPGGPGAGGACPAAVNGGPGGPGGGLPGGIAVGGAGGGGGAAPGGGGLPGLGGAVNGGGGGGGGGATIGGPGAAGGPGAGWGGGGGGGGGADTCPGVVGAPAIGGPGGPGGGGGTAGGAGMPGVVLPLPAPKLGGAGGGGCIQLASRIGQVQNLGFLSASGGQGPGQQGGLGTIVVLGALFNDGAIQGMVQQSYGHPSSQWLLGGGGGGGGAGGDGQPNILLNFQRTPAGLLLNWDGPGVLQSAEQLGGPWLAMPGLVSPLTLPIQDGSHFYRVASPCIP